MIVHARAGITILRVPTLGALGRTAHPPTGPRGSCRDSIPRHRPERSHACKKERERETRLLQRCLKLRNRLTSPNLTSVAVRGAQLTPSHLTARRGAVRLEVFWCASSPPLLRSTQAVAKEKSQTRSTSSLAGSKTPPCMRSNTDETRLPHWLLKSWSVLRG